TNFPIGAEKMESARQAATQIAAPLYLTITFLASPLFAITFAFDDASDPVYVDGWQSGDNGGTGFGPWDLLFSGEPATLFHSPQFIDLQPLPGNSLGAPAFGLTTGD